MCLAFILHESKLCVCVLYDTVQIWYGWVPYDFEMLVLEDGHAADLNPTTYFFYVELG